LQGIINFGLILHNFNYFDNHIETLQYLFPPPFFSQEDFYPIILCDADMRSWQVPWKQGTDASCKNFRSVRTYSRILFM